MISFDTTLTPDRTIRVPDEYEVHAPIFVHVMIDTRAPRKTTFDFEEEDVFDFERANRIRALIQKEAEELLASGGSPEFDALKEFSTDLANVKFDREEIHERG